MFLIIVILLILFTIYIYLYIYLKYEYYINYTKYYIFGLLNNQVTDANKNILNILSGYFKNIDYLVKIFNSTDNIMSNLNNNTIDFTICSTPLIRNINNKYSENLCILCGLQLKPINILTVAQSLSHLSDIKNSKLTVNIGQKNTNDYYTILDLLNYYNLIENEDIYLTYYSDEDLIKYYGNGVDIAIYLSNHPNQLTTILCNTSLSKLLDVSPLTDKTRENANNVELYSIFTYMSKLAIDKKIISSYYRNINIYEQRINPYTENPLVIVQNYDIEFLAVREILLCNKNLQDNIVSDFLNYFINNIDIINNSEYINAPLTTATMLDISDTDATYIKLHDTSYKFFIDKNLIQ